MREGVEEYKQDDIWQISGWEDCMVRREGTFGRDTYEGMVCVSKQNNSGIDATDV